MRERLTRPVTTVHRQEPLQLLFVTAEDVLFGAGKVGVHLARQQGILGNIRATRVFVQRQNEQRSHADDHAKERDVRREPRKQEVGIIAQFADEA